MRGMAKVAGAATALVLVAAPLAAQGGPVRGERPAMGRGMMAGGPEAMIRNPVTVVLDHQEALELDAEQLETLESLEATLAEENGPRWEQLKQAFGDASPVELSVEERTALRERMRELEPVRAEIREANRAVMDQVHELLTDDQRARLRGIMSRKPDVRPGRGMRGPGASDPMIGAAWRSGFTAGMARCHGVERPGAPGLGPGR